MKIAFFDADACLSISQLIETKKNICTCLTCNSLILPPQISIACDKCEHWFHVDCCGKTIAKKANNKQIDDLFWLCKSCKKPRTQKAKR